MPEPELFPDEPAQEREATQERDESEQGEQIRDDVTTLGSRLRVLEEQYTNLRNKAQLTENNLLDFQRDFREELKSLTQDIVDLKHRVKELQEKLNVVDEQVGDSVREHELQVLENYIDLWDPSRFVTQEQLEEMLEEHA